MNGPAPGPHPQVLLRTTRGDVVVRLYPEWAPSTVANFVDLARIGYFDGNRWFRIVPDFVTQTGDPTGDPDSEAGYTIPAEENPVEQRSGIIAMGLDYENGRAVRDSAGTQFYFTLSPQPYLGRDFTVFGEIASGFNVIANLTESDRILLARPLPNSSSP
jgi:cyclophilin family peptidyl-prolyl cis-trans isomerase